MYRQMTAGRRLILVLDSAANERQIRPFLSAGPSCLTIVTSRDRLASLVVQAGSRTINLGCLSESAAVGLLLRISGRQGEQTVARRLAASCGNLPVALSAVAAKAAAAPGTPLSALARELEDPFACLNLPIPGAADQSRLRDMFATSCDSLGSEMAFIFRVLGLLFTDQVKVPAVAAMLNLDQDTMRMCFEQMADMNLLERTASASQFHMHPLWRAYARCAVIEAEIAEMRTLAIRRLFSLPAQVPTWAVSSFR